MDKSKTRAMARQATEYCIVTERNEAWLWEDKYAELIIQECINVVKRKCASPTAAVALIEYFGIKS